MKNCLERGKNADKINGHGKDYIDNRKFLLQIPSQTRHRATGPQPCAPWEISPRDYRDMDTVVDLGPCSPCNSTRCEDIARGVSIKRHFVLSYIYTLCGPGAARTSIFRRVVSENGFASKRSIAVMSDVDSSCNARKRRTCNQTPGMTCHGLSSN